MALGLALGLCFGSVGFGLGGLALAWVGLLWLALGLALAWVGFALGGLCFALGGVLGAWGGWCWVLGVGGVGVWGGWCWGVGCGSGSSPLGVKGRKGRAGLFFAFIVVWVGGLRFFFVRLAGWSWLVFFAFPRALRGWGEKTLSSWSRQGFWGNHRILNHHWGLQKKAPPCSLRPRLSFLRFALPSSWSGLGVCDSSWLVWLVGRGLPPALFPVPCGAGGLGAFIVVSARLLGHSSYS